MTNTDTMNAAGEQQRMPALAELYPIPDGAIELRRLLGTWAINGTLAVEGTPLAITGNCEVAPAAGGWGLRVVFDADIDQLGAYHENDLFGFDAETGMVHLYSITNTAAVHDHPARWVTRDVMEFEYLGTQGGKPYREAGRMEFVTDERIQLESIEYIDGEVSSAMNVIMERQ